MYQYWSTIFFQSLNWSKISPNLSSIPPCTRDVVTMMEQGHVEVRCYYLVILPNRRMVWLYITVISHGYHRVSITGKSNVCSTAGLADNQNNIKFPVTEYLWGESTGHQWIPLTKGPVMWKAFPFHNVIMECVGMYPESACWRTITWPQQFVTEVPFSPPSHTNSPTSHKSWLYDVNLFCDHWIENKGEACGREGRAVSCFHAELRTHSGTRMDVITSETHVD